MPQQHLTSDGVERHATAFPIAYDFRPIGKYLASGRISRLRTVPERVEVLPAMQVQGDDAAQADRVVMDFVQTHGPTTMDALVRSLVTLSWAQVFQRWTA